MGKINRRAKRVKTSIDINWGFNKKCPHAGTIINLTVLGCAIQNKDNIEVEAGQIIMIRFWMPSERILKVEVVHRSLVGSQGFGAKFVDLTDDDKDTLEQLVQLFGEPDTSKKS